MTDSEDDEFDKLLAEKWHKELLKALNNIVESQPKSGDEEIRKAIEKQTEVIRSFVDKIKTEPKLDDNNKMSVSIDKMCEMIIFELKALSRSIDSKPVVHKYEWQFVRGENNYITKAVAEVKYK